MLEHPRKAEGTYGEAILGQAIRVNEHPCPAIPRRPCRDAKR